MTRKLLINKEELIKRTEEYLNKTTIDKYDYKDHKSWDDYKKAHWKNAKATIYARMRAENRDRTRNFWLEQMDNGSFKEFFKKYGLQVYGQGVRFIAGGSPILTSYLENVVLPALEKEMNIKGVKLKNRYNSGYTWDLFNWEQAEVKEVPRENSN